MQIVILTLMLSLGFAAKVAMSKPDRPPTFERTAEGVVLVPPPKDTRLIRGF